MPPPSSKNREDGFVSQRQLPAATVSMSSINFAHDTPASEWPALYDQWTNIPHSGHDEIWLARFEEVKVRQLSLEMPLPLLKLDALVVGSLLPKHSQPIVDSKLVVPLLQLLSHEATQTFAHNLFRLRAPSDAMMKEIVRYAEQLAADHNLELLYTVVRLPVSNRRAFKAALLASSVPSSLEFYWDRNKGRSNLGFLPRITCELCTDPPHPRRFASIWSEALEFSMHSFSALLAIVFSSTPCDGVLLPKVLNAFIENLNDGPAAALVLRKFISKHFDTIQLLDRDFIPTVIPLIVHRDALRNICILNLLIDIAERATPIILCQLLASGVLAELSKLLQDTTSCGEKVRELALRFQQLLLQAPIEHDQPNRPEDRTVGFSLQQQQHDFIL